MNPRWRCCLYLLVLIHLSVSQNIESVVKVRIMGITEALRYSDERAINHPP